MPLPVSLPPLACHLGSRSNSHSACKEDTPCEAKAIITCPCQHRKQEVRCLSTRLNPWETRKTTLKCDDECLRVQRNRQLANALNIDPESHKDDHIPYSTATLKLYAENTSWAQVQEREFRVFAASEDEKRLRFKPMPAHQRAFLHSLAEDYSLDSQSEDPEPHRHVSLFKTPRFVSAPRKTLAQALRLAKATAASSAAASASTDRPGPVDKPAEQAYNAFLLRDPRFGLTVEELDQALASDLAALRSGPGLSLTFTTSFLPSGEVIVKASPPSAAAAVVKTTVPLSQAVETALTALKPVLAKTVVSRLRLAGAVTLCHADPSLNVTKQEVVKDEGGWSAVVSRGGLRRNNAWGGGKGPAASAAASSSAAATKPLAPRSFLALTKKKKVAIPVLEDEPVEDDWETAAEKMDEEGASNGQEETRAEEPEPEPEQGVEEQKSEEERTDQGQAVADQQREEHKTEEKEVPTTEDKEVQQEVQNEGAKGEEKKEGRIQQENAPRRSESPREHEAEDSMDEKCENGVDAEALMMPKPVSSGVLPNA